MLTVNASKLIAYIDNIMTEMAVILYGWQPQMREMHMVCNLPLHHKN